jgi:MSHA biogenesis protein MshK
MLSLDKPFFRLPRRARGVALALPLALLLAGHAARAQEVTDPTRPPQAVEAPSENGGSMLQSIFISDTRRAALIGGQLVELGQKYGDATLVRVAEGEVTLARGREMQVLRLFPGIDKKMVTSVPDAAAAAPVRKKAKSRGAQ